FLVQHRHHEKLAIDVAEVLAKDHGRIPGTADLGLRVRQTALAHQRHAIDWDTVRLHWSHVYGGKEALLLYGRCSCRVHTVVSFCWGDGYTGQGGACRPSSGPLSFEASSNRVCSSWRIAWSCRRVSRRSRAQGRAATSRRKPRSCGSSCFCLRR